MFSQIQINIKFTYIIYFTSVTITVLACILSFKSALLSKIYIQIPPNLDKVEAFLATSKTLRVLFFQNSDCSFTGNLLEMSSNTNFSSIFSSNSLHC